MAGWERSAVTSGTPKAHLSFRRPASAAARLAAPAGWKRRFSMPPPQLVHAGEPDAEGAAAAEHGLAGVALSSPRAVFLPSHWATWFRSVEVSADASCFITPVFRVFRMEAAVRC